MNSRNPFVDFAKGVLILLVVIGHALQYAVEQDQGSWGHPLYKAIYLFHMPLFMALSGYVSFSSVQRSRLMPFLSGKAVSYLVPILAWAVLFGCITGLGRVSPTAIVSEAGHEFIGTRFWFLWALLGSLALTSGVKIFASGRSFLPLYALSTAAVLAMPEQGILYLFKYTYPFFQAGYLIARHGVPSWVRSRPLLVLSISLAITAVSWPLWTDHSYVYLSRMSLGGGNASTVLFRYGVNIVATLAAATGLYQIHRFMPESWTRPLLAFGRNSIYIYMLQGYVFLVLMSTAVRWELPIPGPALAGVLAIGIGISVTWFCWAAGILLAKNAWAAQVFFGKTKRPARAAEAMVPTA